MGNSGWDDSGGRGRRDERPAGRSYDRGRGYDRADRASARGWDDGPRGSGSARPRAPMREDDRSPNGSSGNRYRSPGNASYDRPPRPRPPREDYGEDYDGRSVRGARRPAGPGGSNPRNRPPAWEDDEMPRRRRPGPDDARGRSAPGRGDMRDPRVLRRGLVPDDVDEEEDDEETGSALGKALLIIVFAFLLGAGGAYGYFRMSVPTFHTSTTTPAGATTPSAAPSGTPKTTPSAAPKGTATPSALAPDGQMVFTLTHVTSAS